MPQQHNSFGNRSLKSKCKSKQLQGHLGTPGTVEGAVMPRPGEAQFRAGLDVEQESRVQQGWADSPPPCPCFQQICSVAKPERRKAPEETCEETSDSPRSASANGSQKHQQSFKPLRWVGELSVWSNPSASLRSSSHKIVHRPLGFRKQERREELFSSAVESPFGTHRSSAHGAVGNIHFVHVTSFLDTEAFI